MDRHHPALRATLYSGGSGPRGQTCSTRTRGDTQRTTDAFGRIRSAERRGGHPRGIQAFRLEHMAFNVGVVRLVSRLPSIRHRKTKISQLSTQARMSCACTHRRTNVTWWMKQWDAVVQSLFNRSLPVSLALFCTRKPHKIYRVGTPPEPTSISRIIPERRLLLQLHRYKYLRHSASHAPSKIDTPHAECD